ncbi:hypothetical protein SAMN05216187_106109 [Jeotgalicoccus aerolatus]|uniref:Succinyl-diaminopimelate desuccinylase n=1 Tax=Jeotgalicoccus aerolatus TaxID=709510 RepID=A0A1G9AF39_9STAP|nr:hypothetical protein SAMN05216187_106109 [Jeotgalicoccus aerolatus]
MGCLWKSEAQLENLLEELVSWNSVSGTQGEIDFPYKLKDKFQALEYFKTHEDNIQLFDAGKDRKAFTALYQSEATSNTVVLLSHFDTVGVEEYGQLQDLHSRRMH